MKPLKENGWMIPVFFCVMAAFSGLIGAAAGTIVFVFVYKLMEDKGGNKSYS